jgi:catechol-2,3-dioxygenase
MMLGRTAIARLGAVALDAREPARLARFYAEVLGLEVIFENESFVALKGAPVILTIQQVADLPEVTWPEGDVPKQIHLELSVDDLDTSEKAMLAAGATKAPTQPAPDRWRVLIDPAGHPFCITTLIPEA